MKKEGKYWVLFVIGEKKILYFFFYE